MFFGFLFILLAASSRLFCDIYSTYIELKDAVQNHFSLLRLFFPKSILQATIYFFDGFFVFIFPTFFSSSILVNILFFNQMVQQNRYVALFSVVLLATADLDPRSLLLKFVENGYYSKLKSQHIQPKKKAYINCEGITVAR